jgi:hypothetical protein
MTIGGRDRFGKMGNLGVATIDTADVYSFGGAEEILGEALQGRRDEFVLVAKGFLRITPSLHDIGLSRAHHPDLRGEPAPPAHRLSRPLHLPSARQLRRRRRDDARVQRSGDAGQGPLRRPLESFRLAGDEGAGSVRETQPHALRLPAGQANRSTLRLPQRNSSAGLKRFRTQKTLRGRGSRDLPGTHARAGSGSPTRMGATPRRSRVRSEAGAPWSVPRSTTTPRGERDRDSRARSEQTVRGAPRGRAERGIGARPARGAALPTARMHDDPGDEGSNPAQDMAHLARAGATAAARSRARPDVVAP